MIGWREWSIKETVNDWQLVGAHGQAWSSALAKADVAPTTQNASGIYAYDSIRPVFDKAVFGQVELGGPIEVHADGRIRGAYARITFLVVKNEVDQSRLAHYGVPITVLDVGELVQSYLQTWIETDRALVQRAQVILKPDDYAVPDAPRQKPVEVAVPDGMTPDEFEAVIHKLWNQKMRQRAYHKKRRAQGL
jgi:hypothetical protein